ncbi:hypothetical protein H0A36_07170 [Endozoicomonas sp. SM1973]|uniref:Inositol phosphate phosphatase SopB n=1 Tax=Spartinivicinus marinus TaxID=2994442 RepID=A0A853HVK7_9GAMM|nr:inositol phosphate phosphatase SopB [Spartinivicinus marinus]MCX4025797.1 hypothetical protein [Spartinivicinus marinus]NYZ65790.1 hypothetical protein [Spartinivicinus marinus]
MPITSNSQPSLSLNTINHAKDLEIASDKKNRSTIHSFFSNIGHFFQVHFSKKAKSYEVATQQQTLYTATQQPVKLIGITTATGQFKVDDSQLKTDDKSKAHFNLTGMNNLLKCHQQAAKKVLIEKINKLPERQKWQVYNAIMPKLDKLLTDFSRRFSEGNFDAAKNKAAFMKEAMKATKATSNQLAKQLTQAFEATSSQPLSKSEKKALIKEAKQIYKTAIAHQLNTHKENWQPISKTIEWQGKQYTSEMTPAAELPSLQTAYQNSKVSGISSMTTSEDKHAVNLWVSEFKDSTGSTVFKGVRHGVNTPFGVKDPDARQVGADKRTQEVIAAALELNKDQLINHLQSDNSSEPFNVKLTSTSLLTPSQYYKGKGYKERQFIQEQLAAWQRASKEPKEFTVNINGENKTVKVQLDVLAFNFGVNGGAKLASKFPNLVKFADQHPNSDITGWKMADQNNREPLHRLINWAINYKGTSNDEPKNQRIQTYLDNISTLISTNQHRLDGNRAYALPELVVLLSNEIGVVPAWNCMSGKDRTGLLDAEVKQSLIEQELSDGQVSDFSSAMIDERQALHDKVLLDSGNHEIQKANTGVPGYKIFEGGRIAVASNATNIAEFHRADVRGLSGAVSA